MEDDENWRFMPTFQRRMERAKVEKKITYNTRKRQRSLEIESNDHKEKEKRSFDLQTESHSRKTPKRKSSTTTDECIEYPVSTTTAPVLLSPPEVNADISIAAAASLLVTAAQVPPSPPEVNLRRMERAKVEKKSTKNTLKQKRSLEIENNDHKKEQKRSLDLQTESHSRNIRKRKASTATAECIAYPVFTTTAPVLPSPPAENSDVPAVAPEAAAASLLVAAAQVPPSPPEVNADVPAVTPEVAAASLLVAAAQVPPSPPEVNVDVPAVTPEVAAASLLVSAAQVPPSPPEVNADVPAVTPDAAAVSLLVSAAQVPPSPPEVNADVPAVTPDAAAVSLLVFAAPVPPSPPEVNADVPAVTPDAAAVSLLASATPVLSSPPAENSDVPAVAPEVAAASLLVSAAQVPPSPPEVNADVPAVTPDATAVSLLVSAVPVSPSPPEVNADVPAVTLDAAAVSLLVFAAPVPPSPPEVNADVPAVTFDAAAVSLLVFAAPVPPSPPEVNADVPAVTPDAAAVSLLVSAAPVPPSPPEVNADVPAVAPEAAAASLLASAAQVPPYLPKINADSPTKTTDALTETANGIDDLNKALSTISEPQVNTLPISMQSSRTSRQSPLPSTSNTSNITEQLFQDLYLSDSDDDPYVDSESSYHPENNNSDKSQDENEETNIRKRSKKANPDTWKRNIAKNKRQSGQSYINRKGEIVAEKHCIPTDCSKCRYKCNENFPEIIRAELCHDYWGLGESRLQKIYLSTLIVHANIRRKTVLATKQRAMSRHYFLSHKDTGRMRVCQKFFCNTFCISTSVIDTCAKQMGQTCVYAGDDQRKGLIPGNKTSEEAKNYVIQHIDMFPRIESHYCRKDSKKKYLECDLNMARLYKLYKEEFCPEKNITPVSSYVYEQIFKSYDPPLAFYKPKKDQCTKCNVYKYAEDKTNLQQDYDEHKAREKESLDMKESDKKESIESDGTKRAITFDLQAILTVPHTGDSKIYYLRKFSIYNFTILDNYQNTGLCYMWDESNGKKGSTEIGSILLKYFMDLPENVKTVTSYSDTCSGQNRNKYVTLAALYAVINAPYLESVNFKYMESGHSYLEADSIHASIERARKHKKIFTAREYALVVSSARSKPKPYDVIMLKYPDFYDLKALEKSLKCNMVKNKNNETVKWMNIKWIQVRKESPGSVFYKYKLSDPTFQEIDIAASKTKKKKGSGSSHLYKPLKKAYTSLIPISKAKKKDLMTLLKDGVIPHDYVDYYNNIPAIDEENLINDCSDLELDDD